MSRYANLFTKLPEYWNEKKHQALPLNKRAAESLLGFHVRYIEKLTTKEIDSRITVDTSVANRKLAEIFPAFILDLSAQETITENERKAHAIMLALFHKERGLNNIHLPNSLDTSNIADEQSWLFASVLEQNKRLNEALILYKQAHHFLYEHDARPSIDYANLLIKTQREDEALSILLSAFSIHDKNYILIRNVGRAYLAKFNQGLSKNNFFLQLATVYVEQACHLSNYKNTLSLETAIIIAKLNKNEQAFSFYQSKLGLLGSKK